MEIAKVVAVPKMPPSGSGYFYCFAHYEPDIALPYDIYFSGRDGHHIECRSGVVVFGKPLVGRIPILGESIRFRMNRNNRGPIAQPWGFADEYDKALSLAGVSSDTLYRVVMSVFEDGRRTTTDEVVCEPMRLDALQDKHPIPWDKERDPFPKKMTYGDITHKFHFQRQDVSGKWEMCEDPRRDPWNL